MKPKRLVLMGLAAAVLALGAESTAQVLFNKVRAQVVENIKRMPHYTCVQTITRERYQLQPVGTSCAAALATRDRTQEHYSGRLLQWHDRLRLDVAMSDTSEMYSWAGASEFGNTEVSGIVSHGATGSGEFGAFLISVFGGDAIHFVYTGLHNDPSGMMAAYTFETPLERSHYQYSLGAKQYITVPYHGTFYVDPETADLKRLEIDATEFKTGDVCRISDTMDYQQTKIGQNTYSLPENSSMDVIHRDSTETLNSTVFSGCREYVGESSIRYDVDENGRTADDAKSEALKALPSKTRFQVRIDPPVDSRTGAAGDPITGVVISDVKGKSETILHAGDKLHGRILRMEQSMGQSARWIVAVQFETIERNGGEQKIALKAIDDGFRPSLPAVVSMGRGRTFDNNTGQAAEQQLISERPAGGAIFSIAEAGDLVLDRKFVSSWETR